MRKDGDRGFLQGPVAALCLEDIPCKPSRGKLTARPKHVYQIGHAVGGQAYPVETESTSSEDVGAHSEDDRDKAPYGHHLAQHRHTQLSLQRCSHPMLPPWESCSSLRFPREGNGGARKPLDSYS
eukprot:2135331-Rhodomonas_salina.1